MEEIDQIEQEDAEREGRPDAQRVLAEQVTELVHAKEGLQAAQRITQALFSGSTEELSETDFEQLSQDGLPAFELSELGALEDQPLTSLLVATGLAKNGKQIKDALQKNALIINHHSYGLDDNMATAQVFAESNALFGRFYLVRLGKKNYQLISR